MIPEGHRSISEAATLMAVGTINEMPLSPTFLVLPLHQVDLKR
jgi:hypothetical protein